MQCLANIIYIITLILLIIFNVYIYHAIFSSKLGKYPPYVPTNKKRKKIVLDKIFEYLDGINTQKKVFDAGSGAGNILIPLAKKFPQHKFIGIEWNYLLFMISKIKSKKLKNIEFIHGDILKNNFNEADIIYCYVVSNFEKPLSEKLIKEIKKDCLVVTNGCVLCGMKIFDEIKVKDYWLSSSIYVLKLK